MLHKAIAKLAKWDHSFRNIMVVRALYQSFAASLPIITIAVYWRLIDRLFLSPNALFPTIFNYNAPHLFDPQLMQVLTNMADYAVVLVLTITFTQAYLQDRMVSQNVLPVIINFSVIFLLTLLNFQAQSRPTIQYLTIFLFVWLSCESFYWLERLLRFRPATFGYVNLLWMTLIVVVAIIGSTWTAPYLLQGSYPDFFSLEFFTHFWGLLATAALAPLTVWLGLSLPTNLSSSIIDLTPVTTNLNAIYESTSATLSYPENLYSVLATFAFIGGVGSTLALTFWLLFAKSKHNRKIGYLSFIPSLFDNSQILLFGLPSMLRPLTIVPMILSSLASTTIGYTAIKLGLMKPTVWAAPGDIPHILLGFVASESQLQALAFVLLSFVVSIFIYKPFVKYLDQEALLNEVQ